MSLMKQLSPTTTENTMTAQEVSLQEEEEVTIEQQSFRGLQSQEIANGRTSKVWWFVLWIDRLGQSNGQRSKQVKSTVKAAYG